MPVVQQKIDSVFDPSRVMDIILDSLSQLVDFDLAVILGFIGASLLSVRKAKGRLASQRFEGAEISLDGRHGLMHAIKTCRPTLLDSGPGAKDTWDGLVDLPIGHSCLAVPLSVDGKTVGLLTLDNVDCGAFTPSIVRFSGVIAPLVALALLQSDAQANLLECNVRLLAERNRLVDDGQDVFRFLSGNSPAWVRILDSLRLVAVTDAPVLLTGETGTGKEEAARAIHGLSGRSRGPFVAINCSALPDGLAESEFFGHEKGSFTGANARHKGRFELAEGGTLFLDEVGDLPLDIQPKLLRALQEGKIRRVGGENEISVDIRLVAATNKDLGNAVETRRFREDLYYRLAVFPIRLPSLRERGDDVLVIADRLLLDLRKRAGWANLCLAADAFTVLKNRVWPGNVRELMNVLERAAIISKGCEIDAASLSAVIDDHGTRFEEMDMHTESASEVRSGLDMVIPMADAQKEHILKALGRAKGKIYGTGGAAEILGLKPSTLQSRMKKLGIGRKRVSFGEVDS